MYGLQTNRIEIAGTDLAYRAIPFNDDTPSGAQLAHAAGFSNDDHVYVLQVRDDGELEDVRAIESVALSDGRRFIIAKSDRSYRLAMEGDAADWPTRFITAATLRKLFNVPADKAIYLEQTKKPDRQLTETELVDLDQPGVERFKPGKKERWKLNVQGVTIESELPTIIVKDAMEQAGFDPNQAWIIFLKVAGENKQEVQTSDPIDLRHPGIEKLRLTPRHVENGEAPAALRREFALLDSDEDYLDGLGYPWETVIDQGRRWLILHGYGFPAGYLSPSADLAMEVPTSYPAAQIDMFYVYPPARMANGNQIPRTESNETIQGRAFQRWSRHRMAQAPWNSQTDNVTTQMALVESAILKEVGL
jgi:hypothetical protein